MKAALKNQQGFGRALCILVPLFVVATSSVFGISMQIIPQFPTELPRRPGDVVTFTVSIVFDEAGDGTWEVTRYNARIDYDGAELSLSSGNLTLAQSVDFGMGWTNSFNIGTLSFTVVNPVRDQKADVFFATADLLRERPTATSTFVFPMQANTNLLTVVNGADIVPIPAPDSSSTLVCFTLAAFALLSARKVLASSKGRMTIT